MFAPCDRILGWNEGHCAVGRLCDHCAEITRLRAELADIKETHESVMSEPCPGDDRVHCTCVPALRAEVQTVFRALSKGCAFRGSVITYPDGKEERDERSCNAMGIAECGYYTCPILAAEHKGIEFIIPELNSDTEV